MRFLSKAFSIFILVVLLPFNQAIAQSPVLSKCSDIAVAVIPSAVKKFTEDRGWFRFTASQDLCALGGEIAGAKIALDIQPAQDSNLIFCKDTNTGGAQAEQLIAKRLDAKNLAAGQVQISTIISPENANPLGDGAEITTIEWQTTAFPFVARSIGESWVKFDGAVLDPEDTKHHVMTVFTTDGLLENSVTYILAPDIKSINLNDYQVFDSVGSSSSVDDTVDIEVDTNRGLINWSSGQDIQSIRLKFSNENGETESLTIKIERPYFPSDTELVDKQLSLALVTKIAADEAYLKATGPCNEREVLGDRTICSIYRPAYGLYETAKAAIPCSVVVLENEEDCSDEARIATKNLIDSDIAYRQQLIRWDLPFSGGYNSLKPTTPYHEWIKMKRLAEQMEALTVKFEGLEDKYYTATIDRVKIAAEKAYGLGQDVANQIETESAALERRNQDIDIGDFEGEQEQLLKSITQFQKALDSLEAQQDQLGSKAADLTRAAVATASGVPLDQFERIASGDLKGLAEEFLIGELEGAGQAWLESSEAARNIAEKIGEVEKAVELFEDVRDDAESFESALKGDRSAIEKLINKHGNTEVKAFLSEAKELEKTVEDVVSLTRAMDRERALKFLAETVLTDAQKEEIDRLVDEIKPIERVFEAAYVKIMEKGFEKALVDEFERQLELTIDEIRPDSSEIEQMRSDLKNLYKNRNAILQDPYFIRQVVLAVGSMDRKDFNIVSTILTLDPYFLTDIPQVQDILNSMSTTDRTRAEKELKRIGQRRDRVIKRENRKLCFVKDPQNRCISYELLRDAFKNKKIENANFSNDAMKGFLDKHIETLSEEGVILLHLAKDGPGSVGRNLGEIFKDRQSRLSDAWEKLSTAQGLFSDADVKNSSKVAVAELLTASQLRKVERPNSVASSQQTATTTSDLDLTGGSIDPAADMAVKAALNYALPGAGIALDLAQTWASMDANRDLHEDYQRQLVSAIRKQDQLVRSKQLATRRSALANLEYQRSVAVREAGLQQIKKFELATATSMNRAAFLREKMNLYRPHFYYLAESMRERFDAFDRSLRDWTTGRTEGGLLHQKIIEDPSNARLALDSEIHLFGWLNRNIEATRTSPFLLNRHWQEIMQLVEEHCTEFSCKPGNNGLGQIGNTPTRIFYGDIASKAEKKKFIQWRDNLSRNEPYLQFMSLQREDFVDLKDALNVRIIDVSIVPLDKNGRRLSGSRFRLTHEGASDLSVRKRNDPNYVTQVRQRLLTHRANPPNRKDQEDIRVLSDRFQTQTSVSTLKGLRDFEGYGLFGNYMIEVLPGYNAKKIDNFTLQFSYVYTDPKNIVSEEGFFEAAEASCPDASDTKKTWTGAFCNQSAKLLYKPLTIDSAGDIKCSQDQLIPITVATHDDVQKFRPLGNLVAGGESCLSVLQGAAVTQLTGTGSLRDASSIAVDTESLRKQNVCSASEIRLRATFGVTVGRCFAQGEIFEARNNTGAAP